MANALDPGKYIIEVALVASVVATCVVPAGALLSSELYKMQSDPGQQYDAAMAWFDVAGKLTDAISAAESVNGAVGGSWRDDPAEEQFGKKVADYIREMMVGVGFAITVGIALMVSAIAMFVNIIIGAAMAVGLVIWADAVLDAAATVVGNLGASESLEVAASDYALDCYNTLDKVDKTMQKLDGVLAGGISFFLGLDIGLQAWAGDKDVLTDLGQASVDGIGTIAAGLVARGYQEGVGKMMKFPGTSGLGIRSLFSAIGLYDAGHNDTVLQKTEEAVF